MRAGRGILLSADVDYNIDEPTTNPLGESENERRILLGDDEDIDIDDNEELEVTPTAPVEDPLTSCINELEERVVSALDTFKVHPGTRVSNSSGDVKDELKEILAPVLEIAAHAGPAQARANSTYRTGGVDESVDEMYDRLNHDLILPVMLEVAQSDQRPSKRASALEFFHLLYKEYLNSGSYLDKGGGGISNSASVGNASNAGPYGNGIASSNTTGVTNRFTLRRRANIKTLREGEILSHWVQASLGCLVDGSFTSSASETSISSKAVLSASASIRPALKYISSLISAADDTGATKLYTPVMSMIEGVLRRLFSTNINNLEDDLKEYDAMRSTCIKFLENIILCFSYSSKANTGTTSIMKKKVVQNPNSFSLDMLPEGHPSIKREVLEEIGDYAFSAMRGLVFVGGQVKIDQNLLTDATISSSSNLEASASKIISIIKPAVLAYLDVMDTSSTLEEYEVSDSNTSQENDVPNPKRRVLDRRSFELDFFLSQKSYALAINALSIAGTTRPNLFSSSATTVAERTMDPPTTKTQIYQLYSNPLNERSTVIVNSQLKATCLTLLRNSSSVLHGGAEILIQALTFVNMKVQANKAYEAAKNQARLNKSSRAARNRAALYYAWDTSTSSTYNQQHQPFSETDARTSKRKRDTDDALAKIRAAKMARGLGNGIQLPVSMTDAMELIFANLEHLPKNRPQDKSKHNHNKKVTLSLEYIVDAIMSNGASLLTDENRWYERDGGTAWKLVQSEENDGSVSQRQLIFDSVFAKHNEEDPEHKQMFKEQCSLASADSFGRILSAGTNAKSRTLAELSNQISARLAWLLKGVEPSAGLKDAYNMAKESVSSVVVEEEKKEEMNTFLNDYPLVSSCVTMEVVPSSQSSKNNNTETISSSSLANHILNEGHLINDINYEKSLDLFVSSIVHCNELSNEKIHDADRKRVATLAASSLPQQLSLLPSVTPLSLERICELCNIEKWSKSAIEAKKTSHNISSAAALHAHKAAAERRATSVLLALRDIVFQRTKFEVRRSAVECAVGIATGRIKSGTSIEEKALKLTMNVILPKSEALAQIVEASAEKELDIASKYAIDNFDKIQEANTKLLASSNVKGSDYDLVSAVSEEEKAVMEKVKKPAVLFMALCVHRPKTIKTLMTISSRDGADILSKAVKKNMPKLAHAVARKFGAAKIALDVSVMVDERETMLLLAFLDNLVPVEGPAPDSDFIDACYEIQQKRTLVDGKKDPRYIVPIVSVMKREDLVRKLPEFVAEADNVLKASLTRMSERLRRSANLFREEIPLDDDVEKSEVPSLLGLTLCEQLVFLHCLDFQSAGLPQKRYIEAIRLCIDNEDVYTDRVIMSVLDHISEQFVQGKQGLPLAFMRTVILTLQKYESLRYWICRELLPRLIEAKIYNDTRGWQGWMRCANMLENSENGGASSIDIINSLPQDQLRIYRNKYPL